MKTGATYTPATKPAPLLSIDMEKGVMRRYIRVLVAGTGVKPFRTDRWELVVEGFAKWSRLQVTWDYESLEYIRETGRA